MVCDGEREYNYALSILICFTRTKSNSFYVPVLHLGKAFQNNDGAAQSAGLERLLRDRVGRRDRNGRRDGVGRRDRVAIRDRVGRRDRVARAQR